MSKILFYIVFSIILGISSFSQNGVGSVTPDSCYVHGYITNGKLGFPLENVEVVLFNLTSDNQDTLFTDSLGMFTFRYLCSNNDMDYNLTLSK
ncbi:MAG: hypothetical protein ACPGVD_06660, partial [Flavobacteriales bacterium]